MRTLPPAHCRDRSRRLAATRLAVALAAVVWLAPALPAGTEPSPAEAAFEEGRAALRARDYTAAADALARATDLDPDSAESWLKLGMARSGLQEWDAAIEAYDKAIEIDPSVAAAHNNLANVHFRRGHYEAAAEAYGRALEIDPDYTLAIFHYGWSLRQLNRAEEAEQAFRHCIQIPAVGPRDGKTRVDCLFGLGSMRHRSGDYEAAARMMEEVIAIHPMHPEARYYLGMAYRQLGRLDDARRQLEAHAQLMRTRRKDNFIENPDR